MLLNYERAKEILDRENLDDLVITDDGFERLSTADFSLRVI